MKEKQITLPGKEKQTSADPRAIRTREALLASAKDMICICPPQKITVKELTARAGVHRKTFYLHFRDVEDLLDAIAQEVADGFVKELQQLEKQGIAITFHEINRIFFTYYSSREVYVNRLISDPEYSLYFQKICDQELAYTTQLGNRPESDSLVPEKKDTRSTSRNASLDTVLNKFHGKTEDVSPDAIREMIIAYCVGASLVLYRKWDADGRRIPLKKMIELSDKLLNHGFQG